MIGYRFAAAAVLALGIGGSGYGLDKMVVGPEKGGRPPVFEVADQTFLTPSNRMCHTASASATGGLETADRPSPGIELSCVPEDGGKGCGGSGGDPTVVDYTDDLHGGGGCGGPDRDFVHGPIRSIDRLLK